MALTYTPGGAADDTLLTLIAFKTYADSRGWDYSGFADTTAIEPSLRRATVFVEGMGGGDGTVATRWPGTRVTTTQRRDWPRANAKFVDGVAISSTIVPAAVGEAVAEATWYDLNNAGKLGEVLASSGVVSSEAVGTDGVKITYAVGRDPQEARRVLTAIRDLLVSILVPTYKNTAPAYFQSVGPEID